MISDVENDIDGELGIDNDTDDGQMVIMILTMTKTKIMMQLQLMVFMILKTEEIRISRPGGLDIWDDIYDNKKKPTTMTSLMKITVVITARPGLSRI